MGAANTNNDYSEAIDDEKIIDFIKITNEEAEKIVEDDDKFEEFLQKLENKLKVVPVAGKGLSYVPILISMLYSYKKKEYTEIPAATIISIVGALAYWLLPTDAIPDIVPVLGQLDDAVVVAGCVALIKTDIDDYINWREENGKVFDNILDYDDIKEEAEKYAESYKKYKKEKQKKNKEKTEENN